MSEQLNTVKTAIENISDEMKDVSNEYKDKKEKIIDILKEKSVYLNDLKIKREPSGRYIVNAYTVACEDANGKVCPTKTIQKSITSVLGEKVILQDQKCGLRFNTANCSYTYLSDDKFLIQVGIAKTKKDGESVSGDMMTNVRLGDGKYLVAISDGMGTGESARKNSKIAISMLERLLSSGFDKENSIKLINSAILTANKEESYATLDISILDLFAGNMQLIKSAQNGDELGLEKLIQSNNRINMEHSKKVCWKRL